MITIVVSDRRERVSLVALCEVHDWSAFPCDNIRTFRRSIATECPRVVVVRHKLDDGYSNDVIARLRSEERTSTGIIVLASATLSSASEASQITLGADCVLRDPVRPEVLLAHLSKLIRSSSSLSTAALRVGRSESFAFAGARLDPHDRQLSFRSRSVRLTPREVMLAQLLAEFSDKVVDYPTLYEGILGRRFRGDTSNMRVLLGKLAASADSVGLPLRRHIEVIAKTGYRYRPPLAN